MPVRFSPLSNLIENAMNRKIVFLLVCIFYLTACGGERTEPAAAPWNETYSVYEADIDRILKRMRSIDSLMDFSLVYRDFTDSDTSLYAALQDVYRAPQKSFFNRASELTYENVLFISESRQRRVFENEYQSIPEGFSMKDYYIDFPVYEKDSSQLWKFFNRHHEGPPPNGGNKNLITKSMREKMKKDLMDQVGKLRQVKFIATIEYINYYPPKIPNSDEEEYERGLLSALTKLYDLKTGEQIAQQIVDIAEVENATYFGDTNSKFVRQMIADDMEKNLGQIILDFYGLW